MKALSARRYAVNSSFTTAEVDGDLVVARERAVCRPAAVADQLVRPPRRRRRPRGWHRELEFVVVLDLAAPSVSASEPRR